ncbi:MAG TPA: BatA domain-containing protein [Polyangia bacterium]|jgi:hypothetical protein
MSFLAPGFAIFTVLFVVPIAIHLIGRSRARVQRFAAIDLLLRSERKVARRTRLRQLLLLALRALAIALVPFILAKPFIEAKSDLPAEVQGSQSAVIVLDDSLSMRLAPGGKRLFERAKARARKIIAALGPDADAALVLASRGGGAPIPELTADRARLERAIAEVKPTYRATDVTGALKRAAQILQSASRPERRVYLISDLAAHGFDRDPPWAAGSGPELAPVDVADGLSRDDRAVTDLRVEPAPQLGPRGVRISVDVADFSSQPAKDLPVTLRVDGKPVAKGLLDIDAGQRATKRFFHTFARGGEGEAEVGVHDVEAELEPDALSADDRRFARVEVRRDLRVLIVDGDPRTVRRDDEVFYLETALRPGDRDDSQLDVATITPDELARRPLTDYDVIFLCNVKAGFPVAPLAAFVARGGGLFITLGENVDPDAYDSALGELLPQPLQSIRTAGPVQGGSDDGEIRSSGAGERIGRIDRDHPALKPLLAGEKKDELFAAARFSRFALFRPTPESADRHVLLSFQDGSPALLEAKRGQGRVMLLASSIDRDWNDLAIQPAFLPLMQQATRYLGRAPLHDPEAPSLVGQRHDIPLTPGDQRVEVTLPSGKVRAFERDQVAGRKSLAFTHTDEPGIYRVAVATADHDTARPRPQASFVVNVDPAECDTTRISQARLAAISAGAGAETKTAKAPRRKVELWHALGAALLLLLFGEALLLRRK